MISEKDSSEESSSDSEEELELLVKKMERSSLRKCSASCVVEPTAPGPPPPPYNITSSPSGSRGQSFCPEDQSEPVWVPERLTRRVPASEDGENHKQTNVPDADDHDGDADQQDNRRTPMGDSVGVPETTANPTFCSSFP
ncbi:hypothetical protein H671_6g16683 [Cricetulus griseus]|nr:hypothetical protein H671_6g16683 [Cricetulus griseus]